MLAKENTHCHLPVDQEKIVIRLLFQIIKFLRVKICPMTQEYLILVLKKVAIEEIIKVEKTGNFAASRELNDDLVALFLEGEDQGETG